MFASSAWKSVTDINVDQTNQNEQECNGKTLGSYADNLKSVLQVRKMSHSGSMSLSCSRKRLHDCHSRFTALCEKGGRSFKIRAINLRFLQVKCHVAILEPNVI